MATANQTKVVPYLLVLQSSSATSSLRREDTEDDYNYRRRNKAWLPSTSCTCFCSCFGGLVLTALLPLSITISVIVTLSTTVTEISSTTNTSFSTRALSDGDIVVKTPNGKFIHYNNKGPLTSTD
ncbi:unnamed protein product [Rotaria sp. Silwood1]|nr:unnamed protein product [Rotaria sp. Silwood1]